MKTWVSRGEIARLHAIDVQCLEWLEGQPSRMPAALSHADAAGARLYDLDGFAAWLRTPGVSVVDGLVQPAWTDARQG